MAMGSENRGPGSRRSGGGDLVDSSRTEGPTCQEAPAYPPGSLVGSYWVEELIGEGGTSCVYRAKHAKIGRRVALKALQAQFAGNREVVERFFDEARAANAVDHENIVQVTDLVEDPDSGTHYFVMELLEGFDLRELVELEGALRPERAVRIGVQVADALVAAHAVGVIHRDLKPENIYLVESDRREDFVKVLDFGVAKLAYDIAAIARNMSKSDVRTAPGALVGTPAYMSPEQLSGLSVDHRTDIYSFGMLLYEILTGWPPFKATSFADFVVAHMTEQPKPLRSIMHSPETLPEDLEALVLACLAKSPDERPQTMADVLEGLVAIASREGWKIESTVTPAPVVAAIREVEERGQKEPTLRLHRQDLVEATRPSSADLAVATIGEHLAEATSAFEGLVEAGDGGGGARSPSGPGQGGARPASVEVSFGQVEAMGLEDEPVATPEPTPEVEGAVAEEAPRVRPRRWALPAAVVAILLVGGGAAAAFALLGSRPDGAPAPAAAAEAPRVTVTFRSEPEGAEVFRQGEDRPLGSTPFEASLERGEGAAVFELRREGFAVARPSVSLATSSEVLVTLERLPEADEVGAAPTVEAPGAAGDEGPSGPGPSRGRAGKRPPGPRPRGGAAAERPPSRPTKERGPDRDGLLDPYGS